MSPVTVCKIYAFKSYFRLYLTVGLDQVQRYLLLIQGSHRLEMYFYLEGFLEKSLKIKYALKSTGKSHKVLEKSFIFSIFCRNYYC